MDLVWFIWFSLIQFPSRLCIYVHIIFTYLFIYSSIYLCIYHVLHMCVCVKHTSCAKIRSRMARFTSCHISQHFIFHEGYTIASGSWGTDSLHHLACAHPWLAAPAPGRKPTFCGSCFPVTTGLYCYQLLSRTRFTCLVSVHNATHWQ